MDGSQLRVKFWGVRGSVPVSGSPFHRYGGNTACVEVRCGQHTVIFDGGSGLAPAGAHFVAGGSSETTVLFTHFHYDHIIGMPFFLPIYYPGNRVTLWSGHMAGKMTTRQMFQQLMSPPWFPVQPDLCDAKMGFRDFKSGDVLHPYEGVTIRTGSLNHPGGCIGYRLEYGGRAFAMISDTEHVEGVLDPVVLDLIAGADLVVYDCMYVDSEFEKFRGFGHSTWSQGVRLCEAASAKRLAIYHHHPMRDDVALDEIEIEARRKFAGAFVARDYQEMEL
ncbi:MAG: MBL fold metallo-hydrolase [Rhizobiaceae bacterium]|nr:MBL fold metallo-hydrolase [Rhizobiaceae bacterium]